jgi:GH25 family lysozyme M1 (1,4-beta-N-acetylmuramidase)
MAKYGAHIRQGPRNGFGEFCLAKPAVILSVDDGGVLTEAKTKSGGYTVAIFRQTDVYLEAPPGFNSEPDMVALARQYYPLLKAKWQQNPSDYVTLTNEQGGNDPAVMQRLVQYERELMRLANIDGFKVAILNLATGTPESLDQWKQIFAPFIVEAWANKNIYCRHVYGSGDLVDSNGGVIPGDPSRPFAELGYLRSLGAAGGIALTECGLDAGFGFVGIDRFRAQMGGYEKLLRAYPEFVGLAAWTLGTWQGPGGEETNWQDALPAMTAYLQANPTPVWTWPGQPNPEPIPPPSSLDAYLWQQSKLQPALNLHDALYLWQLANEQGYSVLYTETAVNYEGKGYTIQQGRRPGEKDRLYIFTSGEPVRWMEEPDTLPPLPHVERPLGVDISHHQGTMNWAKTKAAGAWYAFIKATQRLNYTDPQFIINWQGAKAAGLLTAPYHFFLPTYDPIAQAEYFVSVVKATGRDSDLPYVLDVEEGGSTAGFSDMVKACLNRIHQLTGRKPLLYCGIYYANHYLTTVTPAQADLWIANWTIKNDPYMPAEWDKWHFWQYAVAPRGAEFGAQSTNIDLNRWNGTLVELYEYAGNSAPVPPGNTYDLLEYMRGDGRQYELQYTWNGGGTHPIQTQHNGNIFYIVKGHSGEYEECYYDDQYIYRGVDTSEAPDRYYTQNTGNIYGAMWAKRRVAIGEVVTKSPLVIHYWKANCQERLRGQPTDKLTLVAHYPSYRFDSGITLNDVLYLEWQRGEGYFFARSFGLVGFTFAGGKSYISEIHEGRPDLQRQSIPCFNPGNRYYIP